MCHRLALGVYSLRNIVDIKLHHRPLTPHIHFVILNRIAVTRKMGKTSLFFPLAAKWKGGLGWPSEDDARRIRQKRTTSYFGCDAIAGSFPQQRCYLCLFYIYSYGCGAFALLANLLHCAISFLLAKRGYEHLLNVGKMFLCTHKKNMNWHKNT